MHWYRPESDTRVAVARGAGVMYRVAFVLFHSCCVPPRRSCARAARNDALLCAHGHEPALLAYRGLRQSEEGCVIGPIDDNRLEHIGRVEVTGVHIDIITSYTRFAFWEPILSGLSSSSGKQECYPPDCNLLSGANRRTACE